MFVLAAEYRVRPWDFTITESLAAVGTIGLLLSVPIRAGEEPTVLFTAIPLFAAALLAIPAVGLYLIRLSRNTAINNGTTITTTAAASAIPLISRIKE